MAMRKILAFSMFMLGISLVLGSTIVGKRGTYSDPDDPLNFMMPIANKAAEPALLVERRVTSFTLRHPGIFEYEPSEDIRAATTKHWEMFRMLPRSWHEFAPDPQGTDMPLVILLHGSGRSGLSVMEMWKETATKHGLVLVAPDVTFRQRWPLAKPNPAFIHHLIAQISSAYSIDADRIYLFGHSEGAAYAQVLLNRSVGPWKGAALHAGISPAQHLRVPKEAKPFRLYIGSQDKVFRLGAARPLAKKFANAGHPTEMLVIPSHTHWFYEIGPQIAEASWAWFKTF